MKPILSIALAMLATVAFACEAHAWARGNRAGGDTTHSPGSTSHETPLGGSTEHAAGQGTEHSNVYGGSTAHAYGGGTGHTNMYGGST